VLTADLICYKDPFFSFGAQFICNNTGIHFFSLQHTKTRRVFFFVCLFLVLLLWQAFLHQFPRWDHAMKIQLTSRSHILIFFQLPMLLIAVVTLLTLGGLFLSMWLPHVYELYFHLSWLPDPETWAWICLLSWTLWLLLFSQLFLLPSRTVLQRGGAPDADLPPPTQHQTQAQTQIQTQSLQHLSRSLRLSQMILLFLYFCVCGSMRGFLSAQMDCTLISIAIPSILVWMFSLVLTALQV
jgi:hypothetical protein